MSTQTIPSPYNFATVEDRVVLLDGSEYPSNDIPFRDGLYGSITVEFEATRPIYIRSAGHHDKDRIAEALGRTGKNPQAILEDPDLEPYSRFYQLPNGGFALPGTSVKGMLRSVVEILSFSRMFGVENETFSFRPPRQQKQAYKHSTTDCLPAAHKTGLKIDIAEAIFGKIGKDKKDISFRGRVNVEPFAALNNPLPMPPHVAVLNGPKASYCPNYLAQEMESSGEVKEYKTYNHSDAKLRGWKRYPVREDNINSTPIDNDPPPKENGSSNYSIATVFAPLGPGTRFRGNIHFHNLRPWELGALLWAIRLGHSGNPDHNHWRHSIGMAKPLGCGLLKLVGIESNFHPFLGGPKDTPDGEYMNIFVEFVLAKLGLEGQDYRALPQVRDLRAMCSTAQLRDPALLKYPEEVGLFADYKKQRRCLHPFERFPKLEKQKPKKSSIEAQAAPPASTPEPAAPAPLEKVQIEITGQNKKGRWKAQVVIGGMPASAVDIGLIEGDLPADIAQGKIYTAEVLGNTPSQLKFRIVAA
jgi:hypothetical protein